MSTYSAPCLVRPLGPILRCDPSAVVVKRFFPGSLDNARDIAKSIAGFDDSAAAQVLHALKEGFAHRHDGLTSFLQHRFEEIRDRLNDPALNIGPERDILKQLVGAYFVHEYAIQAAALFNPSIVPHPSQENVPPGSQRCIVSLRAVGEGHISSIVFKSGVVDSFGVLRFDRECDGPYSVGDVRALDGAPPKPYFNPVTGHEFVIDSETYEVSFPTNVPLCRRVIFPAVRSQSNGVEDARFVRFEDGRYFATFTAYDGKHIHPQLLETTDFVSFRVAKLEGAITNKGMALFPKRINGKYWMLSRQDDRNILIMSSDSLLKWNDPQVVICPEQPWEIFKMGNCGSPIETPKGWLVLTHGVGPMRRYCIGVAMLDLNDPLKVIGRMGHPLIAPNESEREGYVPNVVYSCGGLLHNGVEVIIPYATSDSTSTFGTVSLSALYTAMGLK